jgi:ABC-type branched-subunit amino acid transport system permease subunit
LEGDVLSSFAENRTYFGLLLSPFFLEMYWQRVLCVAGVYALLALSFDFLAEFVGLVCLGGAFFIQRISDGLT